MINLLQNKNKMYKTEAGPQDASMLVIVLFSIGVFFIAIARQVYLKLTGN